MTVTDTAAEKGTGKVTGKPTGKPTCAVFLHGGAVVQGPQPLHAADARLIRSCRRLEVQIVVVELLGASGVNPRAIQDALEAGADQAVRIVGEPLSVSDAHTTGTVADRFLRALEPDLVLFAAEADPEGLADVPAVIAWRLGAAYVPGAEELFQVSTLDADGAGAGPFEALVERVGMTVRLALPPRAVVGLGWDGAAGSSRAPTAAPVRDGTARGTIQKIRMVTLTDLGLDSTVLRRGDDQRGVIEPVSRPLVSLSSVESLATLLR